jgi:predicted short-subunit dehydrogenase-like oxidoreductase (DUF2520 family)
VPPKPSISIIGPGRLGQSLARHLARAGFHVKEIIGRDGKASRTKTANLARAVKAQARTLTRARLDADVLWLCVPDREIKPVAAKLAARQSWKGKIVLHSSGALLSDELDSLRRQGASAASAHPLMTFVHGSNPSLAGIPFGLEGDAKAVRVARRIIRALGAEPFPVSRRNKALYHVWGMFGSPLLLALMVTAEQVARAAGVKTKDARRRIIAIAAQTLANYASLGPSRSFSGPLVRGDAAVVTQHLKALERIPEARDTYIALVRAALHRLPVRNRRALQRILGTDARS